ERQKLGKPPLPRDLNFLQALEKGLPECFGVAVGFDRLMMLRLNQSDITNVLPIPAQ
ncbi:MAG: EF-P lysine aminoacylase GenX, partial [Simkaniaceae bacterium]|nr:EF-P lysine aminoacylase GenX [Simkaniaceae bacterium]